MSSKSKEQAIITHPGHRVRKLRNEQGLTISALAEQAGISDGCLQRFETLGRLSFRMSMVNKLAKALHITPKQLLGFKPLTETNT